jgi:uncharacterized protein (DUF1330 family)
MTSIEVIAKALGGTYVARGDAVAVIEELKSAGYTIVPTETLRKALETMDKLERQRLSEKLP